MNRTTTAVTGTTTAVLGALLLTACGSGGTGAVGTVGAGGKKQNVNVSPQQHRIRGEKDPDLAAQVPAEIRKRGTLNVGVDADGSPPLTFRASDDKTLIGIESDLATLFADHLGLKPQFKPFSWENIFVGLDSGKLDTALSNITVTQERKQKYDFATYRLDEIAFEAKKGRGLHIKGPEDVAGKRIAVSSGTNQEKILVDWSKENEKAGRKPVDIRYFQRSSDYYLALQSGRIDAYLGPNPSARYHVSTSGRTEIAGTLSGGDTLQGKIAATTRKGAGKAASGKGGSGLAKALQGAVDASIEDGTYAKVLKRWHLTGEAVPKSEVNPAGLPELKS